MYLVEIHKEFYIDIEKVISIYKNKIGAWEICTIDDGYYIVSAPYAEQFLNHINHFNSNACSTLLGE